MTYFIKRWYYFVPAIMFTLFYGFAALAAIGAIHPLVFLWLALLWLAGIFLSRAMAWGGLLGVLPGAYLIYLGRQETGQIVTETWPGVIVVLYYAVCVVFCLYRKKHAQTH